MRKRIVFVVAFALAHSALTVVVSLVGMGVAMAGFEPGTQPVGPFTQGAVAVLLLLLALPLPAIVVAVGIPLPGAWSFVLLLVNGAVCAYLVLWGFASLQRRGLVRESGAWRVSARGRLTALGADGRASEAAAGPPPLGTTEGHAAAPPPQIV